MMLGDNIRKYRELSGYSQSELAGLLGIKKQTLYKYEHNMEQGGWKSDFMLKAVYRNTLDDMRAQNNARINSFFSKSANGSANDSR